MALPSELRGQILPESAFGEALTRITETCENILEIGTWNGRGSTECLRRGLVRHTQRVWSFETNQAMHEFAKDLHNQEPRIIFVRGAISIDIGLDGIMLVPENLIPNPIDLCLIDGGEFNGPGDLWRLYDRTRIFALDDTRELKNKGNLELLLHLGWRPLENRPDERNGWAILTRPI